MTNKELERIKAIRDRNRAAMEAERAEKMAEAVRVAEFERRTKEEFHAGMVDMVDLVLKVPGRPLPRKTVTDLLGIRARHAALELERLTRRAADGSSGRVC